MRFIDFSHGFQQVSCHGQDAPPLRRLVELLFDTTEFQLRFRQAAIGQQRFGFCTHGALLLMDFGQLSLTLLDLVGQHGVPFFELFLGMVNEFTTRPLPGESFPQRQLQLFADFRQLFFQRVTLVRESDRPAASRLRISRPPRSE